jgi:hypothetical protein
MGAIRIFVAISFNLFDKDIDYVKNAKLSNWISFYFY